MATGPGKDVKQRRAALVQRLRQCGLEAEPAFSAAARRAAAACDAPAGAVVLCGDNAPWLLSCAGLKNTPDQFRIADFAPALCGGRKVAISEVGAAPHLAMAAANQADGAVRALLAAPLLSAEGEAFGALCALAMEGRSWTTEQSAALDDLAAILSATLLARRAALEADARGGALENARCGLEQMARLAGVGGWEFEPESGRLHWSGEIRRILETPEGFEPSIHTSLEFFPSEAHEQIIAAVSRCLKYGAPYDLELPCLTFGGGLKHVRLVGERMSKPGRPVLLRGALQDLTERRRREEALLAAEAEARAARERLWNAIEAIPDGFVIYDAQDRLVAANKRYKDLYPESAAAIRPGARFEEILRHGLANGQYLEAIGREEAWLAERMANHRAPGCAVEQRLPGDRWMRVLERPCPNGDVVGFRVEITEIKRVEAQLRRYSEQLEAAKALAEERNGELEAANARIARQALEDPLTGLGNRRRFEAGFEETAARCRASGRQLALLHADLDRFKHLNDSLGHAAGDAALRLVAERLREVTREGDLVARIGGDEFVALVCAPRGDAWPERLAERIVAALSAPMVLEGEAWTLGASVGLAVADQEPFDRGALMRAADIALYSAKSGGRGRVARFEPGMLEEPGPIRAAAGASARQTSARQTSARQTSARQTSAGQTSAGQTSGAVQDAI